MSINIQHHFEHDHLNGMPAATVVRSGKAGDRDSTLHTPRMESHAEVKIGNVSSTGQTTRMNASGMRALAAYLNAAADWMDAALTPEVQYRVPTLLTEKDGDLYYIGPLAFGQWYARYQEGRYVDTTTNSDGASVVNLCDDEDKIDIVEWGVGNTEEEAWRFALGSLFGPADEGYNEAYLLRMIATYEAEQKAATAYDPR